MREDELRREIVHLRARNAKLIALLRVVMVLVKVCEITLARRRVPESSSKESLLSAIERSRRKLPLRTLLRVVGLSSTRYHAWKREAACQLDDVSSCSQSRPHQLTGEERETIKEMVLSKDCRHVPTGTLAILAQRLGKVFASRSTWHRLVRQHRWRRPRKRVHWEKPRLGIRASKCGERMKLVAAISSPAQDDVIEKILRHIGAWDPPWQRQPKARAPPRQRELFSDDPACQLPASEEDDINQDAPLSH